MAFDAFVKFTESAAGASEKIVGESQDGQFPGSAGWFSVKEFSFGIENTINITTASGGAGAGKADFKEFTIKKQTDAASAQLAITCGKGGHYKMVNLSLRKSGVMPGASGRSGGTYLEFLFKMVAVKSVEWSGSSGDDVPEETIVFEYAAMKITYKAQKADGTFEQQPVIGTWNKVTNSTEFDSYLAS